MQAMRYFTAAFAIVTTAVWLGGLLTLALLAVAIFKASGLPRPVAGQAASAMFVWFGKVQLVASALALIAAFLGYLQSRSRVTMLFFTLLAIATVAAVLFNAIVIPRIESLREAGQTTTPEFQNLHRQSEHLMAAAAAVVLFAALTLPAFCRVLLADKRKIESSAADV